MTGYRDAAAANKVLQQQVFWGLMNEGIFANSRLIGCLSTPMGDRETELFLEALRRVLARRYR